MVERRSYTPTGFTLTEILISMTLLGVVFMTAIGVYVTAINFLKANQTGDITLQPMVSVELIAKRIRVSNKVDVPAADQLSVRSDYPWTNCNGFSVNPNSAANTVDDGWWHYRFTANALYGKCGQSSVNTAGAGDTLLISNVNTGGSSFSLINPTSTGSSTVVHIHIATTPPPSGAMDTNPATEIDTKVALGAASKN